MTKKELMSQLENAKNNNGLPVEKNVFRGLHRKMKTIQDAFATLNGLDGQVEVRQGSSTRKNLADESVDYVFTDPPFGGNIPYSEVNFISKAWLGRNTRTHDEVIVSSTQTKGVEAYESLLTKAFQLPTTSEEFIVENIPYKGHIR